MKGLSRSEKGFRQEVREFIAIDLDDEGKLVQEREI